MSKVTTEYYPNMGLSIAELRDGNSIYTGHVIVHPEDEDVVSKFAGCEFAERKAYIAKFKAEWQKAKEELRVLEQTYKKLTDLRDFGLVEHTQVMRHFRKLIYMKALEVFERESLYRDTKESYPEFIDYRLGIARALPQMVADRKLRIESMNQEVTEALEDE